MALEKIPNLLLLYTITKILDSDSASNNFLLGKGSKRGTFAHGEIEHSLDE
jgi:hypothetical protein